MAKGFILGILMGVLLLLGSVYVYFSDGFAPVATSAAPMPFERKLAKAAQHAYCLQEGRVRLEGASLSRDDIAAAYFAV